MDVKIDMVNSGPVARGEFEHAKTPTAGRRVTTVEITGLSPPTPAHAIQSTSLLQALASLRTVCQLLRGVCLHPPGSLALACFCMFVCMFPRRPTLVNPCTCVHGPF